jgi:hypothetical protein
LANPGFKREQHLRVFADLTRGDFVYADNAPERAIPAIIDETSSYYLLAVQVAPEEGQELAARLQVRVKNTDLTVQARTTYRAADSKSSVEASLRPASLIDSISSGLRAAGQPLVMAAMPFPNPDGGTPKVAVVMRVEPPKSDASVPSRDLSAPKQDAVNGVIVVFDRSGRIVASKRQTGAAPLPRVGTTPRSYEVLTVLDLEPGRYEIRAALESRGQRGSVYGFVDVPAFDKAPLALSPIALAPQPPPLGGPRGAFAEFLPLVPTAQRTFAKADVVDAFVRIHRNALNPPPASLAIRVVDADDRVVAEEHRDQADADNTVNLPLDRLSPGEYLLTFTATAGSDRAVQQLRFTVN